MGSLGSPGTRERERFTALRITGHLEASALSTNTQATGPAATARYTDLHAGIAVRRFVKEFCGVPAMGLLGVADVSEGVENSPFPQRSQPQPEEDDQDDEENGQVRWLMEPGQ